MSPSTLLDPAAALLHAVLVALAAHLPSPPELRVVLALVLLTVAVRAALVPLAVRAFHAQRARAALAPELERLRRRYGDDQARLVRETSAAYQQAGVSPLAGTGSVLLQAPVLAALYRLLVVPVIGGHANVVTTSTLFGAPLSAHWLPALAAHGLPSAPGTVLLLLVAVLAALARVSVRQQPAGAPRWLRLLPYGTVAVAAVAPVAVGVYLAVSTAWVVAERAVLTRLAGPL